MPVKPPSHIAAAKFEMPELAFVALGSNLGDAVGNVRRAMDRLQELTDLPLLRSSLWQSTPVDCPPGSPLFVNAVVGLGPRPGESPELLLEKMQDLEKEFGREPKRVLNEPRPLDLDLILFGRQQRDTPRLILPHPRAHSRRFVLQPLSEIAPDLILPGQVLNVRQLFETTEPSQKLLRVD